MDKGIKIEPLEKNLHDLNLNIKDIYFNKIKGKIRQREIIPALKNKFMNL